MDTIVPKMGTSGTISGNWLFSKTRSAVLGLLLMRPDERFHLRQVARLTGSGLGAVQREVGALSRMGILRREESGRQVYYQADRASPIFPELSGLLVKTSGVADVIREALEPLRARIVMAMLFGSFVTGAQHAGSDIDLLVVADPGKVSFAELAKALAPAQARLGREVNPSFYPPAEIRRKWAAGHHFIRSVLGGEKVFLIGDQDELRGMVGKRTPQTSRGVARRA
jgi:predicted nucleotidyltransferase